MRIDYSEPRQSYTIPSPSRQRPSNGISGAKLVAVVILSGLLFGSGFGTGWYFSQQSAKKAFRAAMEQQSLETGAKGGPQAVPAPAGSVQQPVSPSAPTSGQPGTAPSSSHPELPLSFFDNLPKGQKNTVLGSGINERPKAAPAPAAPASAPSAPQTAAPADTAKKPEPAQPGAAKPAPKPAGYLVQVASYSNRKDADGLRSRLSAKGYAATVSETTLEGKTWYRVRIGRHLDKESATQISNQLMMGAKIVPDQDER